MASTAAAGTATACTQVSSAGALLAKGECDREPRRAADEDDRNDARLEAEQRDRGGDADGERPRVEAAQRRPLPPSVRPEHVPGEEQREVDDHADDRGRDARKRRGE